MRFIYFLWFCVVALMLSGNACMRPVPDGSGMPPPDDQTAIRVNGMAPDDIWPRVLGRSDLTEEDIRPLARWMRAEQQFTGHPLVAGNQVQLLIDGPMTFGEMFAAMRGARHHIHLETFILSDDSVGHQLAEILIERRRAGVEVRIVVDAFGALDADERFIAHLREQGVEIIKFHPIDPTEDVRFWRLNTRHHRKVLIVDGHTGFVGGLNISRVYASSSSSDPDREKGPDEAWRDTHVKVEGPVVGNLQTLFLVLWSQLHERAPLNSSDYLPDMRPTGSSLIRVAHSTAENEAHEIYYLYQTAIRLARKTIWITQGYFSPDQALIEELKTASRKGVDVRLLLPGVTDSWITISSSRAHYEELLQEGVRIFERQDVLQHAKTAVVDGFWSVVGSANLDHRSLIHSNEVNLVIWGHDFGDEMEELFLKDQALNREIIHSEWRKRPFHRKLLEVFASMFDYWL